jgi:hypothetical protein
MRSCHEAVASFLSVVASMDLCLANPSFFNNNF